MAILPFYFFPNLLLLKTFLWQCRTQKLTHVTKFMFRRLQTGVILKTEGNVRRTPNKKGTFSLQKVKKGTPKLSSSYVLSSLQYYFDKQIFEKKIGNCGKHPKIGLSFSLKQPLTKQHYLLFL